MTPSRSRWLLALVLPLAHARPSPALVAGGGPAKTDCYAEWQVTSAGVQANHGKVGVDCQDGDPACDVDATPNGVCTFGVSICVFQSDVPGCTPQPLTEVRLSAKAKRLGLQPPPSSTAPTCGPAAIVPVRLRQGKKGAKPSKPLTLRLTALASSKPKRDSDALVLRCVPNTGAGQCPANPAGGPRELMMTVEPTGTDLDSGWTGSSHNFPQVSGTVLRMCLTGCDASTNPSCLEDQPSTDQVNGPTFGPPLPLLSQGIGVCLSSRFASPKLTDGTANVQTGATVVNLHLLSDVFLSTPNRLCPRCSGSDIGKAGTCDSGPRQGQACRTEGLVVVGNAPGNQMFTVSSDCPPPGTPAGTIPVIFPLTTGTSTLTGPKPCPGQSQDDDCRGGMCNATCSGAACDHMAPNPVTGSPVCVDVKGGVSQLCCSSDTTRPCFPTAGGGVIVRTGLPGAPLPAWPDSTYPKTARAVLAGTFCDGVSGTSTVDTLTGLPGPGASLLPMQEMWIGSAPAPAF